MYQESSFLKFHPNFVKKVFPPPEFSIFLRPCYAFPSSFNVFWSIGFAFWTQREHCISFQKGATSDYVSHQQRKPIPSMQQTIIFLMLCNKFSRKLDLPDAILASCFMTTQITRSTSIHILKKIFSYWLN